MTVESDFTPHAPPICTADLPPPGGFVPARPESFRVDEIPAYLPTGAGPHRYIRVEKRGWTTRDVVDAVARVAGVQARDIGYAGQKDRLAVTTQWISVPDQASPTEGWDLPDDVRVLEESRHTNKLRTGHLSGNRFRIELEGLTDDASSRFESVHAALITHGVPNYFGQQRFGRGGRNLGDAVRWLRRGGGNKGRKGRYHAKLLPSVIQSEIFNRYVTARRALDLALLEGEVVRLVPGRAVFEVETVDAELPRLHERAIVPTGPMIGPKMRAASGVPAALEQQAVVELGLDDGALQVLARWAPGTRRDLVVWPTDLRAEVASSRTAMLEFTLPSGSYATQVVREFTRLPWATPLRETIG